MIPVRYIYIFFSIISVLSVLALLKYPGQTYVYIIFTVISNTLLYFGVRKNAIFFDTFIGVFFWLGFWLKLTYRVTFMDGIFQEGVGNFTGSGSEFDVALLVTSCGMFGLIAISYIREKYFFRYPQKQNNNLSGSGLFMFYINNRIFILIGFVILIIGVAYTNYYYGFYQRGSIPKTILPYGLGGIYKWFLLFGLASFSALILKFEFTLKNNATYLPMGLAIAETFLSSVSLLSRAMILNIGALLYGAIHTSRIHKFKSDKHFYVPVIIAVVIIFLISLVIVKQLRNIEQGNSRSSSGSNIELVEFAKSTKILFLDRWVGIEGVLAVTSYPKKGWGLWNTAWKEKFDINKTSFYDNDIITSPYINTDKTRHHFISLPGILAFFFYPGSYVFLFVGMMFIGLIAAVIEFSVYKLGNKNLILCALLSQVVAYRYAHFGYVPGQSYLLFGTLFLNLFIIYFSDKIFIYWYKYKLDIYNKIFP